jgi:hypothetical protein
VQLVGVSAPLVDTANNPAATIRNAAIAILIEDLEFFEVRLWRMIVPSG